MKKISFNLENCYGIRSMAKIIDFGDKKTILIYAPNGTMKTSLANVFRDIMNDAQPIDRIFQGRKTICDIKIDNKAINPNSIFVADAEEKFVAEEKISTFLASKKLKDEYDSIHKNLDEKKKFFLNKLKEVSNCKDCEAEIIRVFGNKYDSDFYSAFETICTRTNSQSQIYDVNYDIVFDKNGKIKKFINDNVSFIKNYFNIYGKLVKESSIFDEKAEFGTYQLDQLMKVLADDSFFTAKHHIVLKNGINIEKIDEFKKLAQDDYKRIINNDDLQKVFSKIDAAISKNAELREFKIFIEKNPTLLTKLIKYENFRKSVWYGYFYQLSDDCRELLAVYKEKRNQLQQIIDYAKKENKTWNNIISIFKNRFYVPFGVSIENQSDIILNKSVAHLNFTFNNDGEKKIFDKKEDFFQTLSNGEKRAFYIMQLLFEIESRKQNKQIDNLIIFDDIADSFDYKNKYAIIEYIADLIEEKGSNFYQIILTHNFDFYRTVFSRLGLDQKNVFMAVGKEDGQIELNAGQYKSDALKNALLKNINNPKCFISLIPFARNIVEHTKGQNSPEYKKLTCCLHIKKESGRIHTYNIFNFYKRIFADCKNEEFKLEHKQIIPFILEEAEKLANEESINEIALENKIVLSIACRLLVEKYLLRILKVDTETITKNQTSELINKYKNYANKKESNLQILDRVSLMTPENIHVNSFMYEPLIDMSVYHLLDLYKDCKKLSRKRK